VSTSRRRFATIDEYIAAFSPDIQEMLENIRTAIRESAPEAEEAIAYGIPTFRLHGNLVHFAAFKHHISFFPGGPSAIQAFKNELSQYKQSKGTVQFPLGEPVPLELVKKMVKLRVRENEARI